MARLPVNGERNWGDVLNEYLLTSHNNDGTLKSSAISAVAEQQPSKPAVAVANGLQLFNVEEYGAVGDGTTDDYKAILAAWNAMLASANGGCLFFPRPVVYRVDAGAPDRLAADAGGSYALFRLPFIANDKPRVSFGIVGVGDPYSPRGNNHAPLTGSVLQIDYPGVFGWSDAKGLPSVFGAPDYDKAPAHSGGTNVHFIANGVTLRQPANPSLCGMNMEACATTSIGSVAFDVAASGDTPEPTHPTGAALLLPAHAGGAAKVGSLLVVGHFTGAPYAEHLDMNSATVLRCKIAVPFRRGATHFGHVATLTVSQCPWGFAGYSPSQGVVAVADTCTVKVDYCDIEDNKAGGAAWTYAPEVGAHFYDPNNHLEGLIWASRNEVGSKGHTDSMWVTGANHFSLFGLFGFTMAGSERIDASAHTPAN